MKQKIKIIISIAICVIGVLWLIPTVFVKSAILEITDYKLISEGTLEDEYEITFSYPKGEGKYIQSYPKDWKPSVGGQDVCHYYTVPPFSVHTGDAPSPVTPLGCIALGILVPFIKKPKFLSKKGETNDEQ